MFLQKHKMKITPLHGHALHIARARPKARTPAPGLARCTPLTANHNRQTAISAKASA